MMNNPNTIAQGGAQGRLKLAHKGLTTAKGGRNPHGSQPAPAARPQQMPVPMLRIPGATPDPRMAYTAGGPTPASPPPAQATFKTPDAGVAGVENTPPLPTPAAPASGNIESIVQSIIANILQGGQ